MAKAKGFLPFGIGLYNFRPLSITVMGEGEIPLGVPVVIGGNNLPSCKKVPLIGAGVY